MLWTATHNEAAQQLFTRLGFRETMIEMTKEIGLCHASSLRPR